MGKQRVQLSSCRKEMRLSAANIWRLEFSMESLGAKRVRSQGKTGSPRFREE